MTSSTGKINFWLLEEVLHYVKCENSKALGIKMPAPLTIEQLQNSSQISWPKVEEITGLRKGHVSWLQARGAFPKSYKRPPCVINEGGGGFNES